MKEGCVERRLSEERGNQPTLPGGNEAPAPQPVVTNGSVWVSTLAFWLHDPMFLGGRGVVPSVVGVVPVVANTLSPKLGRHVSLASASPAPMKSMAAASQNSLYKALMPSNKKVPQPPQQHGMEVLVKHPKTRGNKGDFLKALRSSDDGKGGPDDEGAATGAAKGPQDDSSGALSSPPAEPRNHRDTNGHHHHGSSSSQADDNGTGSQGGGDCSDSEGADCDVGKLSLDDDDDGSGRQHPPLSSSLEAEQSEWVFKPEAAFCVRWAGRKKGSDDDAYAPLTEDELQRVPVPRQAGFSADDQCTSNRFTGTASEPGCGEIMNGNQAASMTLLGGIMEALASATEIVVPQAWWRSSPH
ncbi:hypothetical protein HPB48_002522 [Haemaphysalis longicornis]|uniref:Uncharacterized protein n=1 Tax=Haemaphysalis longicornis TaxID=44386 RepID=A0A9J6FL00_HAELO|nr:hypothetical protein HPB48_002522 [Haemaphysalis longicornis]